MIVYHNRRHADECGRLWWAIDMCRDLLRRDTDRSYSHDPKDLRMEVVVRSCISAGQRVYNSDSGVPAIYKSESD